MTTDVEQLPDAPWLGYDPERGDLHGFSHDEVRTIVGISTAPLQAEIEALRTELDRVLGEHVRARRDRNAKAARAERLAKALRHQRWCRTCGEDGWDSREDGRAAIGLLRDHDQENI